MANTSACAIHKKYLFYIDEYDLCERYKLYAFWIHGLKRYRVLIGGLPLAVDWVNLDFGSPATTDNTYSEAVQTLMEAWAVNHKTDAYPTLLNLDNYRPGRWSKDNYGMYVKEADAVFGQE